MSNDPPLVGKRVLILVGEIYEDLELWYPKLRLEEAGADVVVAGSDAGKHYNGKHGYPCVSDAAISEVRPPLCTQYRVVGTVPITCVWLIPAHQRRGAESSQ